MLAVHGGPPRVNILCCDDHDLFRDGLKAVLEALSAEHALLDARSAEEARAALAEHPEIDLVLLDLGLPDADGLDFLAELRERYATVAVAIVSGRETPEAAQAALSRGAVGFIPKSSDRALLSRALELIFAGGRYAPPELMAATAVASPEAPASSTASSGAGDAAVDDWPLSERQRQVLELLAKGLTNPEIGDVLGIRLGTVKVHVARIFEVLDVSNRAEAVRVFTERENVEEG